MKTIGLIGGMSWESTATYYSLINEGIKQRLGGLHSAKIVLVSVDFAEIEELQMAGDWNRAGQILSQAAVSLQSAGADFFLICTNTMHRVAEQVQKAVNIPLLHIADATAGLIQREGITKVGLLGTAFTMEQDFYKGRLTKKFGIQVLVPDTPSRQIVHDVIYQELCLGTVLPSSQQRYTAIIEKLVERGAQAIILGCTEIGMLVDSTVVDTLLLDTTQIHAHAAVDECLIDRKG